jgi:nucleoside-diphosphate-sugar epimerase
MRVLVLGATGYIGAHLMKALKQISWAEPTGASRARANAQTSDIDWLSLDTLDPTALTGALKGFDAVVNCVAGDRASIARGAFGLTEAAMVAGCSRIVHLSSMAVYGAAEGLIKEDSSLQRPAGWYGAAKREAEKHMRSFAERGGEVVVLRPGCVFGPGSELWVGRTGRWLKAGRLGDLGVAGDGWSNLVHVDDVCHAAIAALRLPIVPSEVPIFNLAASDSPRWNDYFVDLAVAIGAIPVRRIGIRKLQFDSFLLSPPLKLAELCLRYFGKRSTHLPEPIPPGLVQLWGQQIRLDAGQATQKLGIAWTSYAHALQCSAAWFSESGNPDKPAIGKAICTP